MIRTCATCNSTTNKHYYFKLKDGTPKQFKNCVECHNSSKKKPTGFSKLPEDQRLRILELKQKGEKITDIARIENVNYENLRRWLKLF